MVQKDCLRGVAMTEMHDLTALHPEMNMNMLNFGEHFVDADIYRIMHVDRLLELLSLKELILRNPAKWDDPFENYILQYNQKHNKIDFHADMYGQCWSLNQENDAMWRIYSPDKMGVKVKTTVRKLFAQMCLSESIYSEAYSKCFIGKVSYMSASDIKVNCNVYGAFSSSIHESRFFSAPHTLLFKRHEFSHEAEVRLIYHLEDDVSLVSKNMRRLLPILKSELVELKVDPFLLIDEIVLDPRMSEHTSLAYQEYILKLGYSGPVYKSLLYEPFAD